MKGKLKLAGNKRSWLLEREGGKPDLQVPERQVTQTLSPLNPAKHDGIDVEFDLVSGQSANIREVGATWVAPRVAQAPAPQRGREANRGRGRSGEQSDRAGRDFSRRGVANERSRERRGTQATRINLQRDFHNPYNFIPALPRGLVKDIELADHRPAGHDSYVGNLWSGRISVVLKTKTPLLIPDAANAKPNDKVKEHKHYSTRVCPDGTTPYLPPTSIKGMLRSSFEAITNSRLSIFSKHNERLAYRAPAEEGSHTVPARIKSAGEAPVIELYDSHDASVACAAWLPRYGPNRDDGKYLDGQLPHHKDEVNVWIEKFRHWRSRKNRDGRFYLQRGFEFWRVRKTVRANESLGSQPAATVYIEEADRDPRRSYYEPLGNIVSATGHVCLTNKNIRGKHDERVFCSQSAPRSLLLSKADFDTLAEKWKELIKNYREIHDDGKEPLPENVPEWSRHIENPREKVETELARGVLCYARVAKADEADKIEELFPVMISRHLYEVSPLALLAGAPKTPSQLTPAQAFEDLSPADRVFGWVNQNGSGAYRGQLRIQPVLSVTCLTPNPDKAGEILDPIERFAPNGFPLAILGQPKEQQSRFYVAAKSEQAEPDEGKAQRDGITKEEAAYSPGKGLRGRKVYPHQNLPAELWHNPLEDRTQQHPNGHFQEYRRPHESEMLPGNKPKLTHDKTAFVLNLAREKRDIQNRSIKSWVRPDVEFAFDIDVTNLSNVELGALLWLLDLNALEAEPGEEKLFHRLGGGKPFGFGSVSLRIDWDQSDLRKGEWTDADGRAARDDWRAFYSTLAPVENSNRTGAKSTIENFKSAVGNAYGKGKFEQARFIAAFLRCAEGYTDGRPVHYPRARPKEMAANVSVPPNPDGKSYEWFVANERSDERRYSLPNLVDETDEDVGGLPMFTAR